MVVAAGLKQPLVVVGHSLGGFNAKLYAALYPEEVAGLVLVDPAEERDWERTRPMLEKKFGRSLAAKAELLDRSFRTDLLARYARCRDAVAGGPLDPDSAIYRRCSDAPRPQLGPVIAAERQRIQVTAAYQKAQASEIIESIYGGAGSDEVYARLFRAGMLGQKPVIVLTHGQFDPGDPLDVLGEEQGLAVHRETARLSTVGLQRTVPDSGHNLPVEKPEVVISAVEEVLTRLRR
jgi:pimeloyl-ACP methyl ester carboxylesterase